MFGGDDGFEEIGWRLEQTGIGLHTPAHVGDHRIDLNLDVGQGAIQGAVLRQAEIAPIGKRRIDSPVQYRKNFVELLLNDRPVGLDGVDVDTERELGSDIDGEAHEIPTQIDVRTGGCGPFPARQQARDSDFQFRKEGF